MESMGLYVEELTADEFESLTRVFENATDVKYGRQAVSFIDEYAKPDIRVGDCFSEFSPLTEFI